MHGTPHRLAPLLTPRTIALVGASPREGSVGQMTLSQLEKFGFEGQLWPVNPKYESISGYRCYPDIASLPDAPDMVVLAVPNAVLETTMQAAIEKGARSATIFASGYIEGDSEPCLNERLKEMVNRAGIPVCGGNGMGFFNFADNIAVCGFAMGKRKLQGGAVLISHSGSVLSAVVDCEERIGFSLAVSTGNEMATGIADYMDWALERPETTAIAIFMETARRPKDFIAACKKASDRGVPVIALKVGRTETSARLAVSHSGAIAGNDAAYRAVFDRYGIIQVETLDEMTATLAMMNQPRRAAEGGMATMHDSGGERGMWIDLAEKAGVPFADINANTRRKLTGILDYGLEPVNPLDAWGTGRDFVDVFADSLTALASDPDTALAYFAYDREEGGKLAPSYAEAALRTHAACDKPVAIVASRHGSGCDPYDIELASKGIPVIDGEWWAILAARHMMSYRDFQNREEPRLPDPPDSATVERTRSKLAAATAIGEKEALSILSDFGIPVIEHDIATNVHQAVAVAGTIGYPVVMKTARADIAHKSDVGGVFVGIADEVELRSAYDAISTRLGEEVLISRMVQGGVEMALGVIYDPGFGPVVMIGGGGTAIELYRDCTFLLAPFDEHEALRAIEKLKVHKLLKGFRGSPQADIASLAKTAAALSVASIELDGYISEIDINPLIVTPDGCRAVDALIIPKEHFDD